MRPRNRALLGHIRRLLELARPMTSAVGRTRTQVYVVETSPTEVADLLRQLDAELADETPAQFANLGRDNDGIPVPWGER